MRLALTIGENVALPVVSYLTAVAAGAAPVWALVIAAGVSLLVNVVRWLATRRVTTLGLLVLGRFAAGVLVALVTGDARLEIVKDLVITGLIGVVAVATLRAEQPLIARIRRDFAADPAQFDSTWAQEPGFRQLHRRLTLTWAAALIAEMTAGVVLVYTIPLTAAIIVTTVLSPAVIMTLIAWTETTAHRFKRINDPSDGPEHGRCVGHPT